MPSMLGILHNDGASGDAAIKTYGLEVGTRLFDFALAKTIGSYLSNTITQKPSPTAVACTGT